MQETWTLDYPKSQIKDDSLSSFLKAKKKDLGIFLSYYYKKDGAVAEDVNLKTEPQFSGSNSGSFEVDFSLVHFNACLAIHEQVRESLKIDFEFDSKSSKLKLIGPYWPSREMDEI